MMETDRPADHNGITMIEAASQHQKRVNVVIKRKSAGIARTLKSHEADQSSTMAPQTSRRKNRRSVAPLDDDTYHSNLTDDDEKPAVKTNDESKNKYACKILGYTMCLYMTVGIPRT
jgi:hypothetical protein